MSAGNISVADWLGQHRCNSSRNGIDSTMPQAARRGRSHSFGLAFNSDRVCKWLRLRILQNPSMKIVKFFPYNNYLLEGIINQTLFFNNIYNFNDPFEGIFRYKASSNYNIFFQFLQAHFPNLSKHSKYYFENKIEFETILNKNFEWRYKNNAVCCFSEETQEKDILMWSHYADNHKGVCIVYETDDLNLIHPQKIADTSVIAHPTGPYKVNYNWKYLDLDPLKKELNHNSFLTTKFEKWRNEKEYRYIAAKAGNYVFKAASVLQIIFGLRSSSETKETILKLTKNNYPNVEFCRVSLTEESFDIRIVAL